MGLDIKVLELIYPFSLVAKVFGGMTHTPVPMITKPCLSLTKEIDHFLWPTLEVS